MQCIRVDGVVCIIKRHDDHCQDLNYVTARQVYKDKSKFTIIYNK